MRLSHPLLQVPLAVGFAHGSTIADCESLAGRLSLPDTAYEDLNYGASHQFATIGTNNGHDGISGSPFYENPGVVEDYVYRSVHLEAQLGKAVAAEFYGKNHTKAYYIGCSTGGRQGFKEAQSFPEDFDGIVAGAPAFDFNGLMYWTGQLFLKTGTSKDSRFLTSAQWGLVYSDIMRQCDGLDGLEDGIIEDPSLCQYRPEGLLCSGSPSGACLTGEQADTPNAYPMDWWRYALYNDPAWNISTLSYKDYQVAAQLNPWNVSTWEGDLSGARQRGVKILHYHGLQDPAISSDNSERYYGHVSRTMNLPSAELDDFYRYFRISGMTHCSGGTGASLIGGSTNGYVSFEPEANVLAAIVRWVEEGVAPDYILGSRKAASGQVDLQRKHCKYPARNVYKGQGDPSTPDSWECV
ncbi:tannase and feruloyl esterase [Colletotrichum zoysiae]|uniref:Carboxylic ester hydrolase n=1 Tax=Colletotrichum zoysiae TaxID=1216348 RepID=A0AAD9HEE2_9PEZI|nr:tannase and feruloyl esterase [Colletotrichum zoysiae]